MRVFFICLFYLAIQTTDIDITGNNLKFDEVLNYAINHPNDVSMLHNKIHSFVTAVSLTKENVNNIPKLTTALASKVSSRKKSLYSVIIPYLQNYFVNIDWRVTFLDLMTKITSVATPGVTGAPIAGHTYAPDMDSLFEKLVILNPIFSTKAELEEKLKSRINDITAEQVDAIYTYYELYKPYRIKMDSFNALYDAIKDNANVNIVEIEDLIKKFKTNFGIPDHDDYLKFITFKNYVADQVQRSTIKDEVYTQILNYYQKYIYHVRSTTTRDSFLNIISQSENPDFNSMKTALDKYILIHSPIPSNIKEESFGNHLKNKDPSLTDQMVRIIYTYYLNIKLYDKRIEARSEITEKNIQCNSKELISKMSNMMKLYYEPPIVDNEVDLFKVFSKMDQTFSNEHARKIYKCYEYYYKVKERHDIKNKIKKIIPTIKNIIDIKEEMEIFNEKYELNHREISKGQTLRSIVQSNDPDFDNDENAKIQPFYIEFIELHNLENARRNLMNKINENPENIWDADLSSLITTFITGYIKGSNGKITKKEFTDILKKDYKVEDEEINILYIYYSNFKYMEEKRIAKNKVLNEQTYKVSPINFLESNPLIEKFIDIYNIELTDDLTENQLYLYIRKQDGSSQTENKNLFNIYNEYKKYKNRVSSFDLLYKKVLIHKNKFSKMTEEFDAFITHFEINNIAEVTPENVKKEVLKYYSSANTEYLNNLKDKIVKYIAYKNRVEKRFELMDFIFKYPKHKSTDIKSRLDNFVITYKLGTATIHDSKTFYQHLKDLDDGLISEDSNILFFYYKKFQIMWHKQSTRDTLFNYIQTGKKFPRDHTSKIYYNMFIDAYGIGSSTFSNENHFKSFLENQDDTVKKSHIRIIYNPLSLYLSYLKRKSKEDNLYKLLTLRSENDNDEISKHIKQYYDIYYLNYDITSDESRLQHHIEKLDGSFDMNKVNIIYPKLIKYSMNIDRYNILNSVHEFIRMNRNPADSQINPYFETLYHLFQFDQEKVKNLDDFILEVQRNVESINIEKIRLIHPYFFKFISKKKFIITKRILIEYIKRTDKTNSQEIHIYMNPYIELLGLSDLELTQYDEFANKNKQLDDKILREDLDLIFKRVILYLKSNEYISSHESDKKDITENKEKNKMTTDDDILNEKRPWFRAFKSIGIEPVLVEKHSETDLSYYQQLFNDIYRSLTGIKYYKLQPNEKILKMNEILASRSDISESK